MTAFLNTIDWQKWLGPLLVVTISMVLGLILERLLIGSARRVLSHWDRSLNAYVASILQGTVFALCFLWGLNIATYWVPYVTIESMVFTRHILQLFTLLITIHVTVNLSAGFLRFILLRSHLQILPNTSILEYLIRIFLYIIGFLVLLQTLGVSIMPIVTALGVGGLAVSLALQDTLANMFAGINMLVARQFKIGDYVTLDGGHEGHIEDIGWRNTTLRRLNRNRIIVPNSKMAASIVTTNATAMTDPMVTVRVKIAPGSNPVQAEQIALALAHEILDELKPSTFTADPIVRYESMDAGGFLLVVGLPIRASSDPGPARHEMIKRLPERFQQAGITLASPVAAAVV